MALTQKEQQRYKRHLMLPQVDEAGQEKIKNSKVLIVGAGGLGCPVAMQLCCAGVGTIGLMDFDIVDKYIYNITGIILQAPSRVKQLIPKEEK